MTIQHPYGDIHDRLVNVTPQDIKTLVQSQGKMIEGNREFILKEPALTDAHLQVMLNDPYLEVKPIGNQTKNGEMYYDLKGDGRQIRIKIVAHELKETKENKNKETLKEKTK